MRTICILTAFLAWSTLFGNAHAQETIPPWLDIRPLPSSQPGLMMVPPWGYYHLSRNPDRAVLQYIERYTVQQRYFDVPCDPHRYPVTLTWAQLEIALMATEGAITMLSGGAGAVPSFVISVALQITADHIVKVLTTQSVGGYLSKEESLFRLGSTCPLVRNPNNPLFQLPDLVPYRIVVHRTR